MQYSDGHSFVRYKSKSKIPSHGLVPRESQPILGPLLVFWLEYRTFGQGKLLPELRLLAFSHACLDFNNEHSRFATHLLRQPFQQNPTIYITFCDKPIIATRPVQ